MTPAVLAPRVAWTLRRAQGIVIVGQCSGPDSVACSAGPKIRVVAVDLNQTLIVSKSGTLHGENEGDWRWWHESVPAKLRALALEGCMVIITSNQGRLTDLDGNEVPEAAAFKRKMESVMRALEIPVTLLVACANDFNRKPRPGLWRLIPKLRYHDGFDIDKARSCVVGDAAGRKEDFSDSDLHWAMNADIPFYTPEEFFLGEAKKPRTHKFDPKWHLGGDEQANWKLSVAQLESVPMVVLVGLPGSGKTTFYRRYLQDSAFKRLDARSYKDQDSFVMAVDDALKQKTPVLIDDLNIDVRTRRTWTSLASSHSSAVAAIHFSAPVDLCLHNDTVRALGEHVNMNMQRRPVYPRLNFLDLLPRFEQPTVAEGFSAIYQVKFKWTGPDEDLTEWSKFWL